MRTSKKKKLFLLLAATTAFVHADIGDAYNPEEVQYEPTVRDDLFTPRKIDYAYIALASALTGAAAATTYSYILGITPNATTNGLASQYQAIMVGTGAALGTSALAVGTIMALDQEALQRHAKNHHDVALFWGVMLTSGMVTHMLKK